MASLDVLQTRLEALKAARANGLLSVMHGDVRLQYRSMAELTAAIGYIQQEIAQAGGDAIIRNIRITSSKDL